MIEDSLLQLKTQKTVVIQKRIKLLLFSYFCITYLLQHSSTHLFAQIHKLFEGLPSCHAPFILLPRVQFLLFPFFITHTKTVMIEQERPHQVSYLLVNAIVVDHFKEEQFLDMTNASVNRFLEHGGPEDVVNRFAILQVKVETQLLGAGCLLLVVRLVGT